MMAEEDGKIIEQEYTSETYRLCPDDKKFILKALLCVWINLTYQTNDDVPYDGNIWVRLISLFIICILYTYLIVTCYRYSKK